MQHSLWQTSNTKVWGSKSTILALPKMKSGYSLVMVYMLCKLRSPLGRQKLVVHSAT